MKRNCFIGSYAQRRKPVLLYALMILAVTFTRILNTAAAQEDRSLAGQLLVATPEMKDPRFAEAVIYMVKHDADGAFGLVINRPLAKGSFDDLLKGFGLETEGVKGEVVIHYGGPVSSRQGFVLHSDDVLLESSVRVANGIAMTADVKMIESMARGAWTEAVARDSWLFRLGAGTIGNGAEGEFLVHRCRRQIAHLRQGR